MAPAAAGAPHAAPLPDAGSLAVYVISDVHVDHAENLDWIEALPAPPAPPGRLNLLLLAGDISHDVALMRRCLAALRARYDRVFFIHGNHELWVSALSFTYSVSTPWACCCSCCCVCAADTCQPAAASLQQLRYMRHPHPLLSKQLRTCFNIVNRSRVPPSCTAARATLLPSCAL